MRRVLMLLLMVLLALASAAGYLVLTGMIAVGEQQVAGGQTRVDEGQLALDKGKSKLETGKQKSSDGKDEYEQARHNLFLVWADKLLNVGRGFRSARSRIAEGDKKIAKGQDKVDAGQDRLDAGELKLDSGKVQLRLAGGTRIACALGAVFFSVLAIVIGLHWRRSRARILMRTKT